MTATSPARRSRRQPVVPPQHGAWAFVGLPVVVGWALTGVTPLLAALGVAWVAAFPLSYFALAILRYPRPQRFRRPFLLWLAIGAPLAVILLLARPWLIWVGAAYALAFAVNAAFARHHDERSIVNDVVLIAECTAIVPVTWAVAVGGRGLVPPDFAAAPAAVWLLTVAVAAVLIGSTLHVKALIRERANRNYRAAAQIWALACVPLSVALAIGLGLPLGVAITVPFVFFAVRAFVVGRKPLPPGRIGVIELIGFVLLAVAALAVAS